MSPWVSLFSLTGKKYSEPNCSQHFTNEERVKKNVDKILCDYLLILSFITVVVPHREYCILFNFILIILYLLLL